MRFNELKSGSCAKISKSQESYLRCGSYAIPASFAISLYRKLEVAGVDHNSGNLLVKETYAGQNYNYEKFFVLSPNGKSEKYKGQPFLKFEC